MAAYKTGQIPLFMKVCIAIELASIDWGKEKPGVMHSLDKKKKKSKKNIVRPLFWEPTLDVSYTDTDCP